MLHVRSLRNSIVAMVAIYVLPIFVIRCAGNELVSHLPDPRQAMMRKGAAFITLRRPLSMSVYHIVPLSALSRLKVSLFATFKRLGDPHIEKCHYSRDSRAVRIYFYCGLLRLTALDLYILAAIMDERC